MAFQLKEKENTMDFVNRLAGEFKLRTQQVKAAVELLDAGNTIPFIARYRKEATGSLDDQVLREMAERLEYLRNLEKRREEIASSLEEQGALTDELKAQLAKAVTLSELEDTEIIIINMNEANRNTLKILSVMNEVADEYENLIIREE